MIMDGTYGGAAPECACTSAPAASSSSSSAPTSDRDLVEADGEASDKLRVGSPSSPDDEGDDDLSAGTVVGIVVGGVAFIVFAGLTVQGLVAQGGGVAAVGGDSAATRV